jgi:hypothetical protein
MCGVRLSMIDEGKMISPRAVIWTDSAPKWAMCDPALPHFPKAPPPPPPKD